MIDDIDAACVAALILNKDEPVEDHEVDSLGELLFDRFGVDLPNFAELIEALLPFCAVDKSPLTGTVYRGLAKDGYFVVKTEA
jgi:hypothetical protein